MVFYIINSEYVNSTSNENTTQKSMSTIQNDSNCKGKNTGRNLGGWLCRRTAIAIYVKHLQTERDAKRR